jgi:hypothetical protein
VVGTRIERRGCSLTWVAGTSYKGLYLVSFTLYRAESGWRVKREIKLRPKRSQEERTLFVEEYRGRVPASAGLQGLGGHKPASQGAQRRV